MRALAVLLTTAVFALAACGSESGAGVDATGTVESTGQTADLTFEATTLAGEPFDGQSLVGKPAVLWFWAPWCPTCRAQIPNLEEQAAAYGDDIAFVGVGGLDSQASIEETAGGIDGLTHLVDAQGEVWRHFNVTAQSTYTVISADGEIVSEGHLDDGDLNDLIAALADQ